MSGGYHLQWECVDELLDAHIDRTVVNEVEIFRHRIPSATTYTVHGVAFASLTDAIEATTGGQRDDAGASTILEGTHPEQTDSSAA